MPLPLAALETLRVLLAPGGQIRLSPYIEAAQAQAVLGEVLDLSQREAAWQIMLRTKADVLQRLAAAWLAHIAAGHSVHAHVYEGTPEVAHAGLIAQATPAVPQVQLALLDLLAQGVLPPDLRLAAFGDTAGVVAVAALDFFLAVQDVCDLYALSPVVESVTCTCVVPGAAAQANSAEFVRAFEALPPVAERLASWSPAGSIIQWQVGTLASAAFPGRWQPNVAVTGLYDPGAITALEQRLEADLGNALIVCLAPGGKDEANELMRWRREFLARSPAFRTLGPCGAEFGNALPAACHDCRPWREEALHPTPLYAAFIDALNQVLQAAVPGTRLPPEPLKWRYTLVQGGYPAPAAPAVEPLPLAPGQSIAGPVPLRYLSTYSPHGDSIVAHPDSNGATAAGPAPIAYLCPGYALDNQESATRLIVRRGPGKQLPPLSFGDSFQATHLAVSRLRPGVMQLDLTEDTDYPQSGRPAPRAAFLSTYTEVTRRAVERIAQRLFGFDRLWDFQHAILAQVLTGRHILGIAATGGGKSECFILPAMLLPGVTVVVSPLKSLMQDQFEQRLCRRYGLGHLTTYLNGDVPFKERQARLRRLELGQYKLVYVTPEQLERSYVLESLRRTDERIGLRYIALDEAHCISQWGHDFRPSYLNIIRRLEMHGLQPVRIALTATASPNVRTDLCEELGLINAPPPKGHVLVVSSNRPELNLIVRVKPSLAEKSDDILDELHNFIQRTTGEAAPGAAIVFMPTTGGSPEHRETYFPEKDAPISRRGRLSDGVTRFASYLERRLERRVAIYHGKMEVDEVGDQAAANAPRAGARPLGDLTSRTRQREQNSFIQGERQIMVATKGFGMGIDKPNIRLVIHRSPTANLEAYAQEAGRAGRDGRPANVILYYSPDAAEDGDLHDPHRRLVRSDHDIQTYFLSEKYIRREDVLAMRAFLKTVTRRSGAGLYFTGDEVLRFFQACSRDPALAGLAEPYAWPDPPEPELYGRYTNDHRAIRMRGHSYSHWMKYIGRILAALYRIRPDVPALGRRIALLERAHQTPAIISRLDHYDAEAILQSNYYFGRELRRLGFTAPELETLLRLGQTESLLPLARRLGRSLVDTVALINDIMSSEMQRLPNGREQGTLLHVTLAVPRYVDFPDANTLSVWREYAGAWMRAKPKVPKGKTPTLDDWFPWRTVNMPVGWEVEPGPALEADDAFEAYLEAFVRLHDDRQRNDWESYYRLLTEYVGVNADGTVPPSAERRNCLRAALLGYLKTYEVISGGKCYSCSVCVPNEQFDQYSLELRRSVIVHMDEATQAALDGLEPLSDRAPSADQLSDALVRIQQQIALGRSLDTYCLAWSSRLLQDSPGHLGALWFRLTATLHGLFELDAQERLRLARQLVNHSAPGDLPRVAALLDELNRPPLEAEPELIALCAELAERLGRPQRAVELAAQALAHRASRALHLRLRELLLRLHAPGGPLPNEAEHARQAEAAGWLAPTWRAAAGFFRQASLPANWSAVLDQLTAHDPDNAHEPNRGALAVVWLEHRSPGTLGVLDGLAYLVNHTPLVWREIPTADLLRLLDKAQKTAARKRPEQALQIARALGESQDPARQHRGAALRLELAASGYPLSEAEATKLAEQLFTSGDNLDALAQRLAGSPALPPLAEQLITHYRPAHVQSLAAWLCVFPVDVLLAGTAQAALGYLARAQQVMVTQNIDVATTTIYADLVRLRDALFEQPELAERARAYWAGLTATSLTEQVQFLDWELRMQAKPEAEAWAAVHQWLAKAQTAPDLLALLQMLRTAPALSRLPAVAHLLDFHEVLTSVLADWPALETSHPEAADLRALRGRFNPEAGPARAAMLAIVLIKLSRQYNAYWLSPVAMLIEALARAGHFAEAEELAQRYAYESIWIQPGRIPAKHFIAQQKKLWQHQSPVPPELETLFITVADAVIDGSLPTERGDHGL